MSVLVTWVRRAKTTEPVEMVWGLTHVGPRNLVLDGVPDPPMGRGNYLGGCPAY